MQPLWKTPWSFLKKLRIELPYNSATLLLGIYPPNLKTLFDKIYARPCSLQRYSLWLRHGNNRSGLYPIIGDWIKMLYLHTMEYYSAIQNEMLLFVTTWINLENSMLSARSQAEKVKNHMISLISRI